MPLPSFTYAITSTEKGISSLEITSFIQSLCLDKVKIDFTKPKLYKLDPQGTDFQKLVWKALLTIKRGETKTYSEVATMVRKPTAIRAVASAIAKNNIAILIPCHRVIRSDGTLGEYRWGKDLKKKLLQSEGIIL